MPLRTVTSDSDKLPGIPGPNGRAILTEDEWQAVAHALGLSAREAAIMQFLFDDQAEANVARDLGISVHTVHTHLERLYRKLAVVSRCGAVVRVFGAHLHLNKRGACTAAD